jgi:hypothetical protein
VVRQGKGTGGRYLAKTETSLNYQLMADMVGIMKWGFGGGAALQS